MNDLSRPYEAAQAAAWNRSTLRAITGLFPVTALVGDMDQGWKPVVLVRLEELIHLPIGWDGYNGQPVSFANAVFAYQMLEQTCRRWTSPPSIVPGNNGDLQVEWHTNLGDIELHVSAPNEVHAWCATPDDEEGRDLEIRNDFTEVAGWVRTIVERAVAPVAAAA